MSKFVFVTGGVVSGLGKGITGASLGLLLKARGYTVDVVKFDPYFNVDSLYISPYQHGETFVTDNGGDCDSVIGHYERFFDQNLSNSNEVSSGQIYKDVIDKERSGKYKGAIIQVVPHITDKIKDYIKKFNSPETDIVIVEVGGLVGDIESNPFLEAVRQWISRREKNEYVCIHMTYVPYITKSGEQKTKPTQNSVKELQNIGIQPDIIICRSDRPLEAGSKEKLSMFCNVDTSCIVESITTKYLFDVPVQLEKEHVAETVLGKLDLPCNNADLKGWFDLAQKEREVSSAPRNTRVALVGKYTEKATAYQSLTNALFLAAINTDTPIDLVYFQSDKLAKTPEKLDGFDGVVIAPGFGERGFDGKVFAAHYAYTHDIPCLAIGMGAQAAVVDFARTVCVLEKADSQEVNPETEVPVVSINVEDKYVGKDKFRRGGIDSVFAEGSRLARIYGKTTARERHRHKYGFNTDYAEILKQHGLTFTATSDKGRVLDAFEIQDKKFFIGVLFRPEFTSRPLSPHPLFDAFINSLKK